MIKSLLKQYEDLFSTPSELPPKRGIDHCILTAPRQKPINVRPYKYGYLQKGEIENLVEEMLQAGVIKPSHGPYSTPVLLVKKKDGGWCFSIDYRKLNQATVSDKFPLPVIEDLLDELHGASIFSKLDLRSGYHQIKMKEDDIEKTVFRMHEGHYKFLVMSFGLTKCPSHFPISHESGVEADGDKVQVMMNWPQPKDVTGLRGFLGLKGYYRRFVEGYGKIAAPLTRLLNTFKWDGTAIEAFEKLKTAMISAPVLALPDWSLPFIIETDALGKGLGQSLSQNGHPIAFFSQKLSICAQGKSIYERELMAVGEVQPQFQKWLTKLLGYDFEILYQPGLQNKAADALSRLKTTEEQPKELAVMSALGIIDLEVVLKEVEDDPELQRLIEAVQKDPERYAKYQRSNDKLLYKGRLVLSKYSTLIPTLLHTFQDSILGGYSRFLRTYKRMRGEIYWDGMKKDIKNYEEQCDRNKTESTLPAGLLQTIPVLELMLEDWTMDFVEGLPTAGNMNAIMIVVDRLSKYAYFVTLRHPFSAKQVAEVFIDKVIRKHGVPKAIITDQD
ncbi:ty3-gypsy retrotransposon protein [Cucumis melo var. makuwa]|uniref:Ty3-gypsy retrotransposon protein n=1 Tax=Cucumis melo var. makuwa TaxID=1194695 RepID=A0A5D3C3J4_CUCMM|nr:ty3-gypsy retrotransposon protein [Cucumis melo var. makuwa]